MGPLLRWLGLFVPSVKAATTTLQLLARRMPRHASQGDKAPWSELPPELLGLVFSRLSSQADRVRVRAVCRPWRSAARLQPLAPPLPYLLLRDNALLALPDGALHRLRVDWRGIDLRVSAGAVLFLKDRFCRCYLMDPFSRSRETTTQRINLSDRHDDPPHRGHRGIRKVLVSHHIIAVLHKGKVHFFPRGEGPYPTMVWATPGNTHFAVDIALFQGKLCVLTDKYPYDGSELPELHLLDIRFLDISHKQTHIRSVKCIQGVARNSVDPALPLPLPLPAYQRRRFFLYLVVSGDRLLMVELPSGGGSTQFQVWEWAEQIRCRGRWSKVDTLMGRTLFVSADCSRSLPAHSGAPQDRIYYVPERMSDPPQDDCIVYNVKDRKMEQLPSKVTAAMKVRNPDRRWHPTWLFPADD
ncbi:hypothetical protein ACQ4PT_060395 [Festuca glaucescens]